MFHSAIGKVFSQNCSQVRSYIEYNKNYEKDDYSLPKPGLTWVAFEPNKFWDCPKLLKPVDGVVVVAPKGDVDAGLPNDKLVCWWVFRPKTLVCPKPAKLHVLINLMIPILKTI